MPAIGWLTREQYKAMLGKGAEFRGAYLYEAHHAPATAKFYNVVLSPTMTVLKRLIKEPLDV